MATKGKSLWKFGTREVVFAAIGAALYGAFAYATNVLQIPAAANVSIRPGVVIPMFFGVAFGPIVGFITGFLGNFLSDWISGYGILAVVGPWQWIDGVDPGSGCQPDDYLPRRQGCHSGRGDVVGWYCRRYGRCRDQ